MDFQPLFDFYVYANNPDGSQTRINPEHCLLPNSAFQLAIILGQNGLPCAILPGPANRDWDGLFGVGFSETGTVPWFQFQGTRGPVFTRAGEIAAYWIRATNTETGLTDQKTALRNALVDIKNRIEGN